jgi:pyruvate formate lyase activating enzyme
MFRRSLCNQCEECADICERHAIVFARTEQPFIDRSKCHVCGKCATVCPTQALATVGKLVDVDEVLREIDKDQAFYEESKGGITVSGGEPLLQVDFLETLLAECKKKGIHTAVDTSGYASTRTLERIRDNTDLFLYDIKIMDDRAHKKYTGVSNRGILRNFKALAENGSNVLVRLPIVPEVNDDQSNLSKTAEFIHAQGVKDVCLLPYHRAGIGKYEGLDRLYKMTKTPTPSSKKLDSIKRLFEAFGLNPRIGGG